MDWASIPLVFTTSSLYSKHYASCKTPDLDRFFFCIFRHINTLAHHYPFISVPYIEFIETRKTRITAHYYLQLFQRILREHL